MKFNLIQRGNFRLDEDITSEWLYGRGCLLDLDYMGSSEFEWGAVPDSYRRILSRLTEFEFYDTGYVNKNGVPLIVFCHKANYENTKSELDNYLNNPYHLKEFIRLDKFIFPERLSDNDTLVRAEHFWWDIEHDWFGFFGSYDRKIKISQCIHHDHDASLKNNNE